MVLMILVGLVCWFVLPLPLAMAVGRAFRAGRPAAGQDRRSFDLAA